MGLFGWKQLAMWSIEHACLDEADKADMLKEWERLWDDFLEWTVSRYEAVDDEVGELEVQTPDKDMH